MEISGTVTNSTLWKNSLGCESPWGFERERSLLIAALAEIRQTAGLLASEIARDFPEFTVHDTTHADALWDIGSLIAGSNFELNPLEGFLFGAAALIHDLGMASAAYVEGKESIMEGPEWEDILCLTIKSEIRRFPTEADIKAVSEETVKKALGIRLRLLHAKHAADIPKITWEGPRNEIFRLISNQELRDYYGETVGRIAASHGLNIDEVAENLDYCLGSSPSYPTEWAVNVLKVAFLLRAADATQIETRRAPGFLMAIRKPTRPSLTHWEFQNLIGKPVIRNNLLVYNSIRAFTEENIDAWWLAYDILNSVNDELCYLDKITKEKAYQQFEAKGVCGAGNPKLIQQHLRVEGWIPRDASIHVSNLPGLIKKMGGETLYGEKPYIPLRELIQNALDAINARREYEGRPPTWGRITVSVGEDETGQYIEVEDNGVGMSESVISDTLLDFGKSLWETEDVIREYPGMISRGFRPIGKFGIGFFSVFMWGKRVIVTSRSLHYGPSDTLVLEFSKGMLARPLLRKAHEAGYLDEPGTRVRVYIEDEELIFKMLFKLDVFQAEEVAAEIDKALRCICNKIAPAIDADLVVKYGDRDSLLIEVNDWKTIDNRNLLLRLLGYRTEDAPKEILDYADTYSCLIQPIIDKTGELVGRAGICPKWSYRADYQYIEYNGVFTCGGLYALDASHLIGVLLAEPLDISRQRVIPIVDLGTLREWASAQATLVHNVFGTADPTILIDAAQVVHICGGDTGLLPVCFSTHGWITVSEFRDLVTSDELIFTPYKIKIIDKLDKLYDNHFAVFSGIPSFFYFAGEVTMWPPTYKNWFPDGELKGLLVKTAADKWGVSYEAVKEASGFPESGELEVKIVGVDDRGDPVEKEFYFIRKPGK